MIIGVDGCKAGWISIWIRSDGEVQHEIFPRIQSLWDKFETTDSILIDIPIGLLASGEKERVCDREARKILGKGRGSSVFPVPCRPAVYANSYLSASEVNKNLTGKSLSKQSWNITPKIREVDELLLSNPLARKAFCEVHPELSLWGLNKRTPMAFNKKSERGFQERVAILDRHWANVSGIVREIKALYSTAVIARDDIVDAFAILLMGRLSNKDVYFLPEVNVTDEEGIPMKIRVGTSRLCKL